MPSTFRQGWTERLRFRLEHDDLITDLTDYTLALVGVDGQGTVINYTSPKVGVVDATGGICFYDPDPTDLTLAKSPIRVRWQLTFTDGRKAFFPNAGPLVWVIENP